MHGHSKSGNKPSQVFRLKLVIHLLETGYAECSEKQRHNEEVAGTFTDLATQPVKKALESSVDKLLSETLHHLATISDLYRGKISLQHFVPRHILHSQPQVQDTRHEVWEVCQSIFPSTPVLGLRTRQLVESAKASE